MERSLTVAPLHPSSACVVPWYLRLLATLFQWQQNARTRRQLAKLDARALADAGITLSARCQELDKPFWRL